MEKFSLVFLSKRWHPKDILKLTDLSLVANNFQINVSLLISEQSLVLSCVDVLHIAITCLHCKYLGTLHTVKLKYGFHNKSFILNAPLVSYPILVIRSGWVCCCTDPEWMTGIGQLTRGAFRINDLLWNPDFSDQKNQYTA